jgi:hypothetical protein
LGDIANTTQINDNFGSGAISWVYAFSQRNGNRSNYCWIYAKHVPVEDEDI